MGMKGEKSLKDLEIIVGEENFVFVAVHYKVSMI